MKRRETEVTEEVEETTGAAVLAPILATAAAVGTFWWLGKYSTIVGIGIAGFFAHHFMKKGDEARRNDPNRFKRLK